MFVVFQHPFADLRGFIPRSGRLKILKFPLSNEGGQYVRSSGVVTRRPRGGIADWVGEGLFALATNAVRFQDRLGDMRFGDRPAFRIAKTYRRFHSDGRSARLDIGFALRETADPAVTPTAPDVVKAVLGLGDLMIRISSEDNSRRRRLIDAGPALARHYMKATSSRKEAPPKIESWWFQSGSPMALIELPEGSAQWAFNTARMIFKDEEGLSLYHAWLAIHGRECSTWIISCTPGASRDKLRRLRILLTRVHAERHCLRAAVQAVRDRSLPLDLNGQVANEVQEYLRDAVRLLEAPSRDGIDQAALLGVAREAFAHALEDDTRVLGQMRRQIAERVDGFIESANNTSLVVQNIEGDYMYKSIKMGDVTVHGDFNQVVADTITNSFNTATASDANAQLKEALKQLSVEVANLTKQLPPAKAEQAANDLSSLTKEALSKEPRKAWYELSANGLVGAAKAVAEMVPSISKAVAGVLAILAAAA